MFWVRKASPFGGRISYLIRGRVCIRALAVDNVYALLLGSQRDWFLGGAAPLRRGWERAATKAVGGSKFGIRKRVGFMPNAFMFQIANLFSKQLESIGRTSEAASDSGVERTLRMGVESVMENEKGGAVVQSGWSCKRMCWAGERGR